MAEVSTFRLYLMRATYLLIFVGLGFEIWPGLIHHAIVGDPTPRVASSLLAAVSLSAALGIRYPLQMLPLLLFELVWKSIWLIAVALPLWSSDKLDPDTLETVRACLMGIVIFPVVIPWPHVLANYVSKPGGRWMGPAHGTAVVSP
jgi:hypothetical protein